MARIIILGGHGKIARLATPKLVAAGHEVTSVIRKSEQVPTIESLGATAVVADLNGRDAKSFAKLFAAQDIVVWSAGAGGGSPELTYAIDRDAAIASMSGAAEAGLKRYVMVSYSGASLAHGLSSDHSFYPYAQSKAEADKALRDSDLDWTVLGPSALTDDPATGAIEVQGADGRVGTELENDSVSRDDVASVIVAAVDRDDLIGHTVNFNNGTSSIPEAFDSLLAES